MDLRNVDHPGQRFPANESLYGKPSGGFRREVSVGRRMASEDGVGRSQTPRTHLTPGAAGRPSRIGTRMQQ